MKKLFLLTLVAAVAALISGCGSTVGGIKLPDVSGSEVHYSGKNPFGGTDIDVKNLDSSDPTKVTADEISVVTAYPFFSGKVIVKNYVRRRVLVQPPAPVTANP